MAPIRADLPSSEYHTSSSMTTQKGHRWFAAVWDRIGNSSADLDTRTEVAGGATGRVLEVGAGTGFNFSHYGAEVLEVTATEPDPFMLRRARRRALEASRPVKLLQAPAEQLPFDDDSFDTVVSTWVMCSVTDPAKALSEVYRVLKPGGEYRFVDHV